MHAALTAPTAGPLQRCPLEPTLAGAAAAAAGAGVVLAGDRRRTCVLWPFLRPRAHLGRNVVRIALHRLSLSLGALRRQHTREPGLDDDAC